MTGEIFPRESELVIFWVHLESVPARAYLFTPSRCKQYATVIRAVSGDDPSFKRRRYTVFP